MKIFILDQEGGFGGYKNFDGGDVEENVDLHNVKMGSLGFKIFPVAMLKNMSSCTQEPWLHWCSKHFVVGRC